MTSRNEQALGNEAQIETGTVERPELLAIEPQDQGVRLRIRLPEELIYFDGHFDAVPILPGVVQLHWAHQLACEHLVQLEQFSGMERVKFQSLARPGDELNLQLAYDPERARLSFSYSDGDIQYSSGRLCYAKG
ncbi:ApeI family dehydratase [Marinobacterium lutimaris]|uniref:FabA-like domain-containing protein n=1 Tax=Marinobacterium lutimaris TaxID=568106 RepID=A0A1H5TBB0_9GAMM|nr:hypothetical protein [Marinobacterium lutimaris]SEF60080.1 FabA-like domain-containing protein [Marinobacterium lutimaris]